MSNISQTIDVKGMYNILNTAGNIILSSNGNIGIGTTNPLSRFQINSPLSGLYGDFGGTTAIYGSANSAGYTGHRATVVIQSTNNWGKILEHLWLLVEE